MTATKRSRSSAGTRTLSWSDDVVVPSIATTNPLRPKIGQDSTCMMAGEREDAFKPTWPPKAALQFITLDVPLRVQTRGPSRQVSPPPESGHSAVVFQSPLSAMGGH